MDFFIGNLRIEQTSVFSYPDEIHIVSIKAITINTRQESDPILIVFLPSSKELIEKLVEDFKVGAILNVVGSFYITSDNSIMVLQPEYTVLAPIHVTVN